MLLSPFTAIIIISTAFTLAGSLLFTTYKRKHIVVWSTAVLHWISNNATASLVSSSKSLTKAPLPPGKQTPAPKAKTTSNSAKSKQVHFADVVTVNPGDEYSNTISKQARQNESLNTQRSAAKKVPTSKHGVANGKTNETPTPSESRSHLVEINNNKRSHVQSLGSEPSADELDSSVLLKMFNPTKTGMGAVAVKRKQSQRQAKSNSSPRKRHSSDSNQTSYSSEQLFKLIASSSLSRDEVELAIETLLNKLESGETDWQKPKSDPLHRLKNQLRDSEAALAAEIHNHEQTRARLVELKTQLQNERSLRSSTGEELTKIKKELLTTSSVLERAHSELSKQRMLHEQAGEESSKIISKLEEDNVRLQNLLTNSNVYHDELNKLRLEFNENVEQLQRYEAANNSLKKRIHELEANLRTADVHLDQMRADKQQDNYEACAKISELESDRFALEKTLKDHIVRLNEVSEGNKLLEKSLNEAQISNVHKDDMIKRLNDEKHINEASLKRTLFEMEQELMKLHERLSNRMTTSDEKFRQELDQFERELTDAGQREQKLKLKMKQLREGLSELFPELRSNMTEQTKSDDWVQQYLIALRQLTATVDELRRTKDNDRRNKETDDNHFMDSPSKRSVKSNSSISHTNSKSSRVGSPASNGRSSRASNNRDHDKKLMETKLVEPTQFNTNFKDENGEIDANNGGSESIKTHYEQRIEDLLLHQKKLEFQIKVGLDSFRLEQKRVRQLEMELSIYRKCQQPTNGTVL